MKNNAPVTGIRLAAAAALSLLMLGSGGCVYQLGSSLPANLKTMYLPTFVNKSGEPQIESDTTQAAIAEFQKDGTLRVVHSAEEADLLVEVTIKSFNLEPLRYQPNDPKTTKEYRMRINVDIVITKAKTKEIFAKRTAEGEASFLFAGDLTTSKRTVLPLAAKDLAHKIVESVTEAW